MNMKIVYILLMCLLWSTVNAQSTISLDECITLALKNNLRVKGSVIEIDQSMNTKKEAFTRFFPTVSASGGAFMANKGILETELIPGMEMSFLKKGIVGGITATQPLYVGGQIYNSNKLASIYANTKEILLEQVENEVELTTEQYYWQFILLAKKMKTIDMIEELVINTYKDVENSVSSGIATQNDLLEVELKINKVASDKLQITNAIKHVKMFLGQHIGLSVDSFVIEDIKYDELISPTQYKVPHKNALLNTVTYRLNDMNLAMTKIQTKIERGKYMPSVAIGAGYMYHNLLEKSHPVGVIYATVSLPISQWWGGKYTISNKKNQEKLVQLNINNSNEMLLIQMQQNFDDLEVAFRQIEISRKSITSAAENVRLNNTYFKAGTINLTTLLNSQFLLQDAHDSYTEKYTEYLMKLSKYKKLTNSDN